MSMLFDHSVKTNAKFTDEALIQLYSHTITVKEWKVQLSRFLYVTVVSAKTAIRDNFKKWCAVQLQNTRYFQAH